MKGQEAERTSVRGVLAVREYRALLSASALSTLGDQVTRIAVAVLVYERTASAFFAAATIAVSYLTWLVGGPFLSALADRHPRRRLMVLCDLTRAALVAVLVVPGLPLWAVFAVLVLVGVLAPPFQSAESATLADVLDPDAYPTGNALSGAVGQGAVAVGFLVGGALVGLLEPRGALAVDAATFLVSAALIRSFVRDRGNPGTTGASLARETLEGFALVARSRRMTVLLAYGVLGSVPVIAPEGLAVPVADALDGGGATAGILIAAVPVGFLLGSAVVMRVPTERRDGLLPGLTALSCVPLLLTPVWDSTTALVVLWSLVGAFSAAQLIANASYVLAAPAHARGRAFGVAASVIMATQGLALLGTGWLAEAAGPQAAVAWAGALALALLLPLHLFGGSPTSPRADAAVAAQARADLCRSSPG